MKSSQLFGRARLLGTVMPAALVVGSFAVAGPARAQGEVETMIVTAQRVEENIQKVPIAVTAFSAASLQTKGITDVAKLSDATPNVTFDASTPFSATSAVLAAAIRGIGQDDFAINLDPGVGVYIDGVYLARSVGANVDMLDVDRVEILKGPQGTLFGRNTIGGAVNIVTHEPGTEFTAKAEVTGGSFQRFDLRASADIPITDKFRTSIAFSTKNREGYQKHINYPYSSPYIGDDIHKLGLAGYDTSDTSGGQDSWNVRMKFLFQPNDVWKVTLAGDYTLVDEESVPYSLLSILENNFSGAPDTIVPFPFNQPFASQFIPNPPGQLGAADGLFIGFYNNLLASGAATVPPPTFAGGAVCFVSFLCTPRARLGTAIGGVPLGPNVDADPNNNRLFYGSPASLAFWSALSGLPLQPSFYTNDPDLTYSTGPNFAWMKTWGYSGTVDVSLNDHTNLKNIIAFRGLSWKAGMDLDGSPVEILSVSFNMHQHQFSEEMQLTGTTFSDRLKYVIGGYYFSEAGDLHDLVPFPGGLLQVDGPNTLATWTYAFYGNFNFKVTDQLSLTLGGRYSYEHKEFEGFQSDPNELTYKAGFGGPGGDANHDGIVDSLAPCWPPSDLASAHMPPAGTPGFPFVGFSSPTQTCLEYFGFPNAGQPDRFFPAGVDTQKFYLFTPKIGLEWSPTEDLMAYFSWSKGYKSGGWTTRLSFPNATPPRFGPEKARTFEGGIKSEWFDRRLRLNLAGFRTNYLGIQQNAFKFISPTIENAGDAHIHGAEAEITALFTDNFVVNASLGWLKAKYVELSPTVGAELLASPFAVDPLIPTSGGVPMSATPYIPAHDGRSVTLNTRLRKTPEWKFTISPQYTIDMDQAGAIVLNLDYTYTSSLANDTENTFELNRPSVNSLNLSVTYKAENGHWEAAVGATNLTDDRYIVSGQANRAGGNISGAYNAPREWFATVRVKY